MFGNNDITSFGLAAELVKPPFAQNVATTSGSLTHVLEKNELTTEQHQHLAPTDFVLIGEVGCGKTALMNALLCDAREVHKTQAAEFHQHNAIDTPGEFIGRRSYYGALLATIAQVSTIVYLQAANSDCFCMPSGLLQVYPGKRVIGVISKVDAADANIDMARDLLRDNAIPEPYFETSTVTGAGIDELRAALSADTRHQ